MVWGLVVAAREPVSSNRRDGWEGDTCAYGIRPSASRERAKPKLHVKTHRRMHSVMVAVCARHGDCVSAGCGCLTSYLFIFTARHRLCPRRRSRLNGLNASSDVAMLRAGRLLLDSRRRWLSSSSRAPLLPRWGSFGKTSAQLSDLVERITEDGARQSAIQRELAEVGLKVSAMVMRPVQWFGDPEWRTGWIETAREPLDRYSRVNDRLLDGCEEAYSAIASEFHAENPDFQRFVESGALEPELATFLEEALAKYAAAGRRPMIEFGRCNGQVLLIDSTTWDGGFVATVVFRSREARDIAPVQSAGASASVVDDGAAAGGEAATSAVSSAVAADGATAIGEVAVVEAAAATACSDGARADGAASPADADPPPRGRVPTARAPPWAAQGSRHTLSRRQCSCGPSQRTTRA